MWQRKFSFNFVKKVLNVAVLSAPCPPEKVGKKTGIAVLSSYRLLCYCFQNVAVCHAVY